MLQLLLLLLRTPVSDPADESLPFPDELSLWALGEAHIGLDPKKNIFLKLLQLGEN